MNACLWQSNTPDTSGCLQIVMQAQQEQPPSLSDCKDKFMVMTCTVPAGSTEASEELFMSRDSQEIQQTKLRVVLMGPPVPSTPVSAGSEEAGASHGQESAQPRRPGLATH